MKSGGHAALRELMPVEAGQCYGSSTQSPEGK